MKIFVKPMLAVLCMMLTACGGGSSDSSPATTGSGGGGSIGTDSELKAYVSTSPYASAIAGCVENGCNLTSLPLIGLVSEDPSVDDIMNHVAVSHDWMGMRFKQHLERMPQEMRLLFRAVTGIVLAHDIRPSHYRSDTGAIYLDPAMLWMTNEEKATIEQTPDFRSNFGKDLQFIRTWRYVIDNDYAWQGYSLTGTEERTVDDTIVALSWLLYHELAHANDCATPENMTQFNTAQSFYQNHLTTVENQGCVYQQLTNQVALQSSTWLSLAQVFFHGTDSTAEQRDMVPVDAGQAFADDYAMDAYSYSSLREDVAMAFEAVLMKKNFNADRDMAILPQFQGDFNCDNAQVKWGQRGRLSDADVIERSKFVTDVILPTQDLSGFYAGLPSSVYFNFDHNWCEPSIGRAKYGEVVDAQQFAQDALSNMKHGYVIQVKK